MEECCQYFIEIESTIGADLNDVYLEIDTCTRPILVSDLPDNIPAEKIDGSIGNIDGSGLANYITKWVTDTTIGNSIMYQDGVNIGVGTTTPTYKLEVNGSFSATTKSFKIQHPSKCGKNLEYGSLESPYHGVRLTGKDKLKKGKCVIKLPSYIRDLVKEDGINIQLTNYKHSEILYVDKIDLDTNRIVIKGHRCKELKKLEFFWTFTAIRKDVPDLIVEK